MKRNNADNKMQLALVTFVRGTGAHRDKFNCLADRDALNVDR